ncbi:MAG: hypothetical protein C0624_03640 [Desulfuromonas sp.]|nr:MAG: hypothetical protein C0624_03640 [Desulfuromonas sp.]
MSEQPDSPKLDLQLAQRLHRALTASSEDLYQVLQDPAMEVVRCALKNQHLNEEHLLTLLKRRDLSEDIPKALYKQEKVELSHRLKLALVKNPATPTPVRLTLLPQLRLFELVNLLQLSGTTPDQKLAAERQIIKRLPTTPLGNKLTLARRSSTGVLAELLKEGDPQVFAHCLANPRLKEVDIFKFLNSGRSTAETISQVARHERWKNRPNLRLAILKNRNTPSVWYTLWLPRLPSHELRNLLYGKQLAPRQKKLINDEISKRGL